MGFIGKYETLSLFSVLNSWKRRFQQQYIYTVGREPDYRVMTLLH